MNLLLALLGSIVFVALGKAGVLTSAVAQALVRYVLAVNMSLMFFNLIPLGPLDGAAVLAGILPESAQPIAEALRRYGMGMLFLLLLTRRDEVVMSRRHVLAVGLGRQAWSGWCRMSAEPSNAGYRVALPEFEGPLDLLLHLCKTHELDIVNIPISFVTEKYLEYLEVMQSMSVDVAADYLVMAATLATSSRASWCRRPSRWRSTAEEPERCARPARGADPAPARVPEVQGRGREAGRRGPSRAATSSGAACRSRRSEGDAAAGRAVGLEADRGVRQAARQGRQAIAPTTWSSTGCRSARASTSSSIGWRRAAGSFRFDACFDLTLPEAELRDQVVVTLLAILELARLKVVRVLQSTDDDTLFISQVPGDVAGGARGRHGGQSPPTSTPLAEARDGRRARSGTETRRARTRAEARGDVAAGRGAAERERSDGAGRARRSDLAGARRRNGRLLRGGRHGRRTRAGGRASRRGLDGDETWDGPTRRDRRPTSVAALAAEIGERGRRRSMAGDREAAGS